MSSTSDHLLVVGGGISGVVTALAAIRDGRRVTLVERAPNLGGLLASSAPGDGTYAFDFGTHIPAQTGDASLDEALFGWMSPAQWHPIDTLRAGTFWNGQLSTMSQFLDVRTLPPAAHAAVLPGLLASTAAPAAECTTLSEQLEGAFGHAMLEHVFNPILQKLYGTDASRLAPDAHQLFGLARFLCGTPAESIERKRDPAVDAKLAFHPGHEPAGTPTRRSWYPRRGGVGAWIDGLQQECVAAGVHIRTGATLGHLNLGAGRTTIDGADVTFDEVAWCLPAALLLRQCGHAHASTLSAPSMSRITLHHLVIDRPLPIDSHYVTCHDPDVRAFRVTLYDNLQPGTPHPGRITVEILDPQPSRTVPTAAETLAELMRMGIVTAETSLITSFVDQIPAAFPIQTVAYRDAMQRAVAMVTSDCPRVRLIGRAGGRHFFMRDVLADAWTPQARSAVVRAAA